MSKLGWRTKIIALFVLVLGASLLFQLIFVVPYVQGRTTQLTEARQLEIAHGIARELVVDLTKFANTLLPRIAARTEFRDMDLAAQQQTMKYPVEISLFISSLWVLDAEGWFAAGTVDDLSPYTTRSYADQPFFSFPFEQGQPYFSLPRYYPDSGIVGVSVSVPIESEAGERVGVLIGVMRLNETIEYVSNYPLEEGTMVSLMDNEGTIIARSGLDTFALEGGPLSINTRDCPYARAITDKKGSGSLEHEYDGVSYFCTFTTLESNNWTVVVRTPMQTILATSDEMFRLLLLVNTALFAGALAVSLVFARQITAAQARAEAALRQEEQRYRALFEQTSDAVFVISLEGLVLKANQPAADMLGYTVDEIVGRPVADALLPSEYEDAQVRLVALLAGETLPVVERTLRRKDGTEFPAEVSLALARDAEGKPLHLQNIVRDITERKQTEQQRIELAVERERMATLSDFIADVSHEFGTPLSVINASLYLLSRSLESEEQTAQLAAIQEQATYIGELIAAMLTMSRLDGITEFAFASLDLNRLLRSVKISIHSLIDEKNLTFTLDLDDDLPAMRGDERNLHLALTNIVKNAAQYTEEGTITVRTYASEGCAVVEVSDTGIGIGAGDLPRIFERFYRADKARTTRRAGLGLSIAERIVEAHRGRIEVESAVGEGSTFRVWLPLYENGSTR